MTQLALLPEAPPARHYRAPREHATACGNESAFTLCTDLWSHVACPDCLAARDAFQRAYEAEHFTPRPWTYLTVERLPQTSLPGANPPIAHVAFTLGGIRVRGILVYEVNANLLLNLPTRPVNGRWTDVLGLPQELRDMLRVDIAAALESEDPS